MPSITIVVPVFKVEQYLERCVESILSQTLKDYDVILVDDGSPDNSGYICDRYTEKYSHIHVIHKPNGGLSSARNAGIEWSIENSNSQWITFIDSDDWIHPEFLELLLNGACQYNSRISACNYHQTLEYFLPTIDNAQKLARLCSSEEFWCDYNVTAVIACAKLYKKSLFRTIRFPDGKLHEDEFTTYKLLFENKCISFIDAPLYCYFQNEQSIMHSSWSPKHIAESEAKYKQLIFFIKNGFEAAAKNTAKSYLFSLYRNLQGAINAGRNYKNFTRKLKRSLQISIIRFGKIADITLTGDNWIYYSAFPIGTMPYRALKKFFKK